MQLIDFQAQAGSSITTFSTLKIMLNRPKSVSSLDGESFSKTLQRSLKSKQSEQGEQSSSDRVNSRQNNQEYNDSVKDTAQDETRNTEAPGGTDALTSDQESGQLEVKDESENNTDIDTPTTTDDASEETDAGSEAAALGALADLMQVISQELEEIESGLTAAVAGISSDISTDDSQGSAALPDGSVNLDEILTDVQELEATIQQLAQALEDELAGLTGNAGSVSNDDSLTLDVSQLKIMLRGDKLTIKEHIKGNHSSQANGGSDSAGSMKFSIRIDSGTMNAANSSDGNSNAGQQPGQEQGSSQLKKIMLIENNKLNMVKMQEGDSEPKSASAGSSETITIRTSAMDGLVVNQSLVAPDGDTMVNGQEKLAEASDPQEMIDQIVKKLEIMTRENTSEIKIQLKPEFLGKMTIKLSMEEGILTAKFITDNQQVKNMLDSNLALFKQQLEASGVKVEKAEVSVQLGSGTDYNSMAGNPQSQWQFNDRGNSENTVIRIERQEAYSDYTGEELDYAVANPLYDDIEGDSSVSYIV